MSRCRRSSHTSRPDGTCVSSTARAPRAEHACRTALSSAVAGEPHPWHSLLYDCLRDQAVPAFIDEGAITPAASIWTGSRLWVEAFRKANLEPGDRIVISMPPSAAFVQVLVAALWQRLTIALAPANASPKLVHELDARAIIHPSANTSHTWVPDGCAGPLGPPDTLRPPTTERTPEARFLLRTSGTTGTARWFALSDANVLSVLASHLPYFKLKHSRVLSVLPWSHAFGLVLDLLPALLSGAEIIRDPEGGRSASSLFDLRDAWGATHLCAVPLTIQRLLDHDNGLSFLMSLDGGIVGGAPVSAPLAEALTQTSLRVGYGQTEASPGIALGDPGVWAPNYLGRPLGCTVRIDTQGQLLFQGKNACIGQWTANGLAQLDPDRWVPTGDRAERRNNGLYFQGRTDDAFKLMNGRMVHAGPIEARLKEAFDGAHDVFVWTPDGSHLAVALCWDDSTAHRPADEEVCPHLKSLQDRLQTTLFVPPNDWPTTSKGAVDRSALQSYVSDRVSPHSSSLTS